MPAAARVGTECINSGALCHHAEHAPFLTLAGHDMLRGRAPHARMSASDYAHISLPAFSMTSTMCATLLT
jgi:hypothetical protein